MKLLTILCLAALFTNCNAQKISSKEFSFKDAEVEYLIVHTPTNPIQNFYVILSDSNGKQLNKLKDNIGKCISSNEIAYLSVVPKDVNKEEYLLEFISHITNRTKLIDSNLIIITEYNYSDLYNFTRVKNNGHYKHGYLNEIREYHLFKDLIDICEVIK